MSPHPGFHRPSPYGRGVGVRAGTFPKGFKLFGVIMNSLRVICEKGILIVGILGSRRPVVRARDNPCLVENGELIVHHPPAMSRLSAKPTHITDRKIICPARGI